MRLKIILALLFGLMIVAAGCGDDSDSDTNAVGAETPTDDASSADAATDGASGGSDESGVEDASGVEALGGASILTLDGESIALDSRGCYAERQEVAGSIITLSAQASGTNAAGEDVIVDFTRFAPDGVVGEADDFTIDIGPLGSSRSFIVALPFESVPIADGVLTLTDTTVSNFEDGSEVIASIAIAC